MTPDTFTMKIEKGKAGLWYATSPEIKGLLVGEKTLAQLFYKIPFALSEMQMAKEAT